MSENKTPMEWGDALKLTEKSFTMKNSDFTKNIQNLLKQIPERRKLNINSFGFLPGATIRAKFIHTLKMQSVLMNIEITCNENNNIDNFVFYKNEKF